MNQRAGTPFLQDRRSENELGGWRLACIELRKMAMDFMDIRKRVYVFPKMGEKAMMVSIPTSSGTGSEVTPFAIITDATTGTKWPIADSVDPVSVAAPTVDVDGFYADLD